MNRFPPLRGQGFDRLSRDRSPGEPVQHGESAVRERRRAGAGAHEPPGLEPPERVEHAPFLGSVDGEDEGERRLEGERGEEREHGAVLGCERFEESAPAGFRRRAGRFDRRDTIEPLEGERLRRRPAAVAPRADPVEEAPAFGRRKRRQVHFADVHAALRDLVSDRGSDRGIAVPADHGDGEPASLRRLAQVIHHAAIEERLLRMVVDEREIGAVDRFLFGDVLEDRLVAGDRAAAVSPFVDEDPLDVLEKVGLSLAARAPEKDEDALIVAGFERDMLHRADSGGGRMRANDARGKDPVRGHGRFREGGERLDRRVVLAAGGFRAERPEGVRDSFRALRRVGIEVPGGRREEIRRGAKVAVGRLRRSVPRAGPDARQNRAGNEVCRRKDARRVVRHVHRFEGEIREGASVGEARERVREQDAHVRERPGRFHERERLRQRHEVDAGDEKGDRSVRLLQGKGRRRDGPGLREQVIPHPEIVDRQGEVRGYLEGEEEVFLLAQAVAHQAAVPGRKFAERRSHDVAGIERDSRLFVVHGGATVKEFDRVKLLYRTMDADCKKKMKGPPAYQGI